MVPFTAMAEPASDALLTLGLLSLIGYVLRRRKR
jgi:hypothetical protein